MSDEGRDRFEIPKEMRSMAEASFEQARKAFEKFVATAQAAAGYHRGAQRRNSRRHQGCQQQGHRLCRKERAGLARLRAVAAEGQGSARGDAAARRVCAGQMRALAEQASEMGQVVGKAAMDAAKPKV